MEDEAWYRDVGGRVPQGRFGELWEVVGSAVFLASRTSSLVTGTPPYSSTAAGRQFRDRARRRLDGRPDPRLARGEAVRPKRPWPGFTLGTPGADAPGPKNRQSYPRYPR